MSNVTIHELVHRMHEEGGPLAFRYGKSSILDGPGWTVVLTMDPEEGIYRGMIRGPGLSHASFVGINWTMMDPTGACTCFGKVDRSGCFRIPLDAILLEVAKDRDLECQLILEVRALETREPVKLRPAWERRTSLKRQFAVNVNFEGEESSGSDLPSEGGDYGISSNGRWFVIRIPLENDDGITFPLGCALIEYLAEDGRVLGQWLTRIVEDRERRSYFGQFELSDLPEGVSGTDLDVREVTEETDCLAKIPRALLPPLLESVEYFPAAKKKVEILKRLLAARG